MVAVDSDGRLKKLMEDSKEDVWQDVPVEGDEVDLPVRFTKVVANESNVLTLSSDGNALYCN